MMRVKIFSFLKFIKNIIFIKKFSFVFNFCFCCFIYAEKKIYLNLFKFLIEENKKTSYKKILFITISWNAYEIKYITFIIIKVEFYSALKHIHICGLYV